MSKAWLSALFLVMVGASPALDEAWEAFKVKFGKSYKSEAEEGYRMGIFKKNLELIDSENAKGESYSLGVNQFADLLTTEWSAQYFGLATPTALFGGAQYLGRHVPLNSSLPESIDWEEKGVVTPVKNQGQCGSCWAFSATGALEGAYALATGKLVSISEQQFVDCARPFGMQGCSGGLPDGAFKYAEKFGMCTEDSYQYTASEGTCDPANCATGIPRGGVVGFKDVEPSSKLDLMSAVAQQPVSIGIEADRMSFQLYKHGVFSARCGSSIDHAVLVVGYGTDPTAGDYWKVKNSWGASWGMGGYILLKRGKGGVGECGLLTLPSYPVVSTTSQEIAV